MEVYQPDLWDNCGRHRRGLNAPQNSDRAAQAGAVVVVDGRHPASGSPSLDAAGLVQFHRNCSEQGVGLTHHFGRYDDRTT